MMNSKPIFFLINHLIFLLAMLTAQPSKALELEFNSIGMSPLGDMQDLALQQVEADWQARFQDPITIKVNIVWQQPNYFHDKSLLASIAVARTTVPVKMVVDALLSEATPSERDLLLELPTSLPVTAAGASGLPVRENLTLTFANAKALAISPAPDPDYGDISEHGADLQINLNRAHADKFFLYTPPNVPNTIAYDFIGVINHEIAHGLGFTSIVDLQHYNPSFDLNPSVLDVFRFSRLNDEPLLQTSVREITPGVAQFFDTDFIGQFAAGLAVYDAKNCYTSSRHCSASHRTDTTPSLMTSAQSNRRLAIHTEDETLINRIGYDQQWRNGIPILQAEMTLMALNTANRTELEYIDDTDRRQNYEVHIHMDGHKGVGYATFEPARPNTKQKRLVRPRRDNDDYNETRHSEAAQQGQPSRAALEADADPIMMANIRAHFTQFSFESSNPFYNFTFIATASNHGIYFDPNLGHYGGFRISGYLDGDQDGEYNANSASNTDVDGSLTLLMVLDAPHDISKGLDGASFSLLKNHEHPIPDNIAHIIDNTAFSLPEDYYNYDSYEDAHNRRVEQIEDPEPMADVHF